MVRGEGIARSTFVGITDELQSVATSAHCFLQGTFEPQAGFNKVVDQKIDPAQMPCVLPTFLQRQLDRCQILVGILTSLPTNLPSRNFNVWIVYNLGNFLQYRCKLAIVYAFSEARLPNRCLLAPFCEIPLALVIRY